MVDPQDLPKQGNRRLQPNGKARNNGAVNTQSRLGIRADPVKLQSVDVPVFHSIKVH
jgi:hypothetical protein